MRSWSWPVAVLLFVAFVAFVACGPGGTPPGKTPDPVAKQPDPVKPTRPAPDLTSPTLRLPTGVKPTRNTVELTLDPATEDFTGTIVTDLELAAPTDVVWLNAEEITVDKATFTAGGESFPATASPGNKGYLALVPDRTLAAGPASMRIEYRGKMHRNDGTGIYTAESDKEWYLYTQFEAMDARSAFPCFDEPSFKVPWQLTIHARKDLMVLGNTPVDAETAEANDMKAVKFAETPPMPSYLVAFAVGPFEAVDAGASRHGIPLRVIVPRGRAADAAWPVESMRPVLDLLEDYFGTPYPYAKLDVLSVAVFNAGAMENPGLITYREEYILSKPSELTLARKQTYSITLAHEIAHMWFGDYVTLAWWDDTWLNEAFATWMEAKVIDQWKPEWDVPVELVNYKSGVMGSDSLETARAIRQPIESEHDIANAFDGITYQKGNAVLTMLERWIGPEKFQAGVRAYLAKHAWKNATYDDFVEAIAEASGQDVHAMFDSFVKQSGVPIVDVKLSCAKKGDAKPTLQLAQRRYAPTGSKIDPNRTWQIPVCVRWGARKATGKDCTLLTGATGELALSSPKCPTWVMPNEAGLGYYRMAPDKALLASLLKEAPRALTLPERVSLIGDVNALVASGAVDNAVALSLVETLAKDKNRHLVDASIGLIAGLDEMVPDKLRPNYERLIKKRFRARAVELGWRSKPGEDENSKQLRPGLLALVAGTGKDAALIEEATELVWKWVDDHGAIEPELVGVALGVAGRYGDQKLYDRLYADAKKATDRQERERLLAAMGAFVDPKIVKQALALILTDEFDLREASGLMQGAFADPRTRATAYAWVKEHFDEIANKLPAPYRAYMAFTFVALCDDDKKPEIKEFFQARIEKFEGGPRIMEQALETMSLCSAARKAQTPGVVAFLKRQ